MRTVWRRVATVSLAIAFTFLTAHFIYAQVDTGSILGTVKDASGAVVPGAKVTIVHEGTGLTLSSLTREDGTYIFTPIRIGTYRVEVEYSGFQKGRRLGIELNIQQQAVVDFSLVPGEITQTVEVTSAAPVLQTQSGSVGEAITSRTIMNLPLSGRNYTFLARLTAGVTHSQPEGRGLNANGWFAANGTRPAQNNYLLDGIDNNSNNVDFLSGAAHVVRPPVDAIAEFKIQTNAFSAEFGRAGGAVLNATLRSGTNEIHGSIWEFLRNDKLDAADFFQNASGQKKGKFRQNQFGVAVGGPLIKNKTFWFADYEGTRIRQGRTWVVSVPTAAQRASGFTNFSDLISGQSGTRGPDLLGRTVPLGTIFDPATTRSVTAGQADPVTGLMATGSGFVRDPFPGNIIPQQRLNPNAVKLLNLYPSPTSPGLVANYGSSPVIEDDTNAFDVRFDHNFSDHDQVFVRYSFADSPRFKPGPFEGFADGGGFNEGDEKVRTQGAALSYTHTFSPTLINEVRVGFNREHVLRLQPFGNDTSNIPGQFGIQGIPQIEGNGGLPTINIGGLQRLGTTDWLVSERFSNTAQLSQNLTKIYKSHTLKGGVEIQHITFPWIAPPWARGWFSFQGFYTSIPNRVDNSTGSAQLLLTPIAATVPNGNDFVGGANQVQASNFGGIANNKDYYGIYFQDDWKVSPKLTLNFGLRWDHFSLVGEDFGAQANFIPLAPRAGAKFVIPASREGNPALSSGFASNLALDGIELVYSDEFGTGLGLAQKKNFAPRFGFAYQFTPKLVVRGGYGIYYGAFENRGGFPNLGYNYPFQFDFNFQRANDASPVRYPDGSTATLERGLLGVPLDPRAVSGAGLNLRGIEFNYKTPYTQGYNLTVQYELSPQNAFEVGYVASLGRHLETFSGTNHVNKILPPDVNPALHITFPSFARGSSYATTDGNSHYHSLQTKFTRRMSKGLDFLAAYTWAKTLTNAGDALSGGNAGGLRAPGIPGFGIQEDFGLASFHVNHAFSYSGTYELPFGQGRYFLSQLGGVGQAILGGWSTNWILALYTGQPQTIGCTITAAAGTGCYALLVPGKDPYGGKHSVEQFYNPEAFANPPVATTIGQTDFSPLGGGRTQVTGPPYRKLDFSLFKQFQPSERTRLEFRTEVFNLTNTPSFANPSVTNFTDTLNFGRITSTRNNPNDARQIQFALKLYW
jgi:hypothetical protein